jgi:hypothetical protein
VLDVVQEVGGVAGWAGVVGLTVLSALHVSQARDVKRLREWAGRAPERSAPSPQHPITTPAALRAVPGVSARFVAVALAALLVLGGAAAYGVVRLTGGRANSGHGSPNKPKPYVAAVKPGNVTVAVLNGTTVPGLAAMLRDRIAAAGFQEGTIDVFSDQQLAESVVQYAPGHQADAKAVGRSIGIGRREPINANSRALAGAATVIVIAGADKAP